MKARLPFHRRPTSDPEREAREQDAYERTHRVLLALPEQQWSVVSPYELRHDQCAHVLAGGGGVYLIVARKPPGTVRVKDGVPWLRYSGDTQRERAGTDVLRKILEPAQTLGREVRSRSGRPVSVHSVVVLWSEFPQGVVETNQVTFVHGRQLAGWLRARQTELEPTSLEEVARAVTEVAAEHARREPSPSSRPPGSQAA